MTLVFTDPDDELHPIIDAYLQRAFTEIEIRNEIQKQARNYLREGRIADFKPSEIPDTLKALVEE